MKKNKSEKWAIGALLAGIVGYLAGILTAPKSGKETRQDIHDKAVSTKKEAEAKLKDLHKELNDLIASGKSQKDKLTKRAQSDYGAAVEKAQGAKKRASELLSAIHEGEADDEDLHKAIDEAKKASEHLKKFLAEYDKKDKKSK